MVMFYALLALCFASSALAQVAEMGGCPKVETMQDFNIRKIQGRWFESKRFFALPEMDYKCLKNDILHDGSEGIMLMNTTAISRTTGKMLVINGMKIRVPDAAEPGKLELQLPYAPQWQKFWILGSDYNDYMVGYRCVDYESINLKSLWILTRQQQPSKAVIDDAIKVMESQNLNATYLITAEQTNCDAVEGFDSSNGYKDAENSRIAFY